MKPLVKISLMQLWEIALPTGSAIVGNPALPWSVDLTFTSLILVFVGIGFALASLIDGYLFNDPYPGYGSVGKDRNENQKEINRMREHLSSEITHYLKMKFEKQEKVEMPSLIIH